MPDSQTDIIEIARSRELNDEIPTINLPALEKTDGDKLLSGDSSEPEEKQTYFKSKNLKKKHAVIAGLLIVSLIFSAAYADSFFRGDSIANGVSVDSVDIGGLSTKSAEAKLDKVSSKALDTPITFSVDKKEVSISSQDLDLVYENKATVESAKSIASGYNPIEIVPSFIKRYTVGEKLTPKVSFDKTKFDAVVQNIVNSLSIGRADASVVIEGTTVTVVPSKSGDGVSEEQATKALNEAIETFSREEVVLKSESVGAQISLAEAERTASILRTMFSKDTTITTPSGNSIIVPATTLASTIVVTPQSKKLNIGIDSAKMRQALGEQLAAVELAPTDASFSVSGSSVSVIPSVAGKQIDFNAALVPWIKGSHNFQATVVEVEPKRNTRWAQSLNITEVVSSFSTNFTAGQARVKNIARAAEQVNNTIVEPGETFSLNQALGRRTAENGYVKAPVYSDADGFFEDFGGGASQFSTTLFNAAFIGGYEDITHTPHTIYISRYPMGREATLNWGSIDMAFKNDSDSGILIRTGLGQTSISVTLYGNKEGRTVKLEGPVELGRIPIATEYTDDPTLPVGTEKQTQAGYPGIVVDNFRTVTRNGKEGRRERYRWTYNMVPRKVIRGTNPGV